MEESGGVGWDLGGVPIDVELCAVGGLGIACSLYFVYREAACNRLVEEILTTVGG